RGFHRRFSRTLGAFLPGVECVAPANCPLESVKARSALKRLGQYSHYFAITLDCQCGTDSCSASRKPLCKTVPMLGTNYRGPGNGRSSGAPAQGRPRKADREAARTSE